MFVTQTTVQEVQNAKGALVLAAVFMAVFWRAALRALFAILIVAVGAGAVVLLHAVQQ